MNDLTAAPPPGRGSTWVPERPEADPRDAVAASFRLQNPLWSLLSDQRAASFPAEPGYNPMADIRGSKYEARYASRFYGSLSGAESNAIRAQIDREEKDREIGQAAGWAGTIADIVAGSLDPTIALPGAVIMRGARGGIAIGRSAIASGAALGAQVAGQEAVLQGSQATRSWEETAGAIATGTLLGALLGSAASGFMSRAEYGRAKAGLDDLRAESAERLGLLYEREADAMARAGVVDEAPPLAPRDLPAMLDDVSPSPVGRAESVGAAAADTREVRPVSILSGLGASLEKVPVLRDILVGTNPVTRTNFSDNVMTRRVSADLVETGTRMEDHLQGRTTTAGAPAETHIRVLRDTMQAEATDVMTDAFARYRFGEQQPRFAGTTALVEDWRGTDKLSRKQFAEAVSDAMRNGDRHEIAEVQAAAREIRAKVMDPLWEAAKKVFPDLKDLDRTTAESYMKRQWNQRAMRERPTEFVDMVTAWLRGEQEHNRAVQRQVSDIWAGIQTHQDMLDKLQRRIATVERRAEDLSTRMAERRVGATAEADRAAALREREGLLREQVEEIETGIDWLKAMDLGPDMRARLAELEGDLRALNRRDRSITLEDLDEAERWEVDNILSGDLRVAAEMVTGKRKVPETPSFLHWVAKQGGIADVGGDARAGLGDIRIPGLVRRGEERNLFGSKPVMALDDWGERLAEMDPTRADGQGGFIRYSPDEVMRIMEDAARGNPPAFWLETLPEKTQQGVRAADIAASVEAALDRIGVTLPDMKQVSMLWQGEEVQGRTLADLERALGEMEAAGSALPMSVQREAAENAVVATRRGMAEARAAVRRAQEAIQSRERRAAAAGGAAAEVEMAGRRRVGRLGVLQERVEAAERLRGVLDDMVGSLAREIDTRRATLEKAVGEWRGDTIAEAESAWKARAKAEEGRAPEARRLRSADNATDNAVKRIIDNRLDLDDAEFRSRAGEIMNRLDKLPDGRLPYDGASGAGAQGFGRDPDLSRWRPSGPFASREFMIPDNLARPFLVNDADHLISSYIRQTIPDVVLGQKFGDPMMTQQIKAMREEWDAKIAEASASERVALAKAKEADERDIAGMRDRLRGTYGLSSDSVMRSVGRWARAARNVNTVVNMGSVAGYALGDAANGVFRVGLGPMLEAWTASLRAIAGNGELAARAKREYRAMGAGLEAYQASRMHALDDISNAYHNDTFFERTLAVGAERMNLLNLNAHATNYLKIAAASAVGDQMMQAAQKAARGTASAKDLARLAESGIDASMAERVARAFDEGGGEKIEGLFLPNTENWTDGAARQAFENAVARDVNMAVITPGQDKPLWFSNQAFGVLGQFKSYMAAFHSRVLLPNLQVQDARTLHGLGSAVMAGMLGYALMSAIQGRDMSKMTPADWVKEGLSRGGVFGWLEEGNGVLSKVTGGRADMYNLIGATPKESSRYESRNIVGALLGPTAGKIQSLATVTSGLTGDEWTAADTRALRQLMPLQNLIYIRGLVDQVERSTNDMLGVQNPERR